MEAKNQQELVNLLYQNGWQFTESVFLNPANAWEDTQPEGLLLLRAIIGNGPFTPKVIERLKTEWSAKKAPGEILEKLILNDDKLASWLEANELEPLAQLVKGGGLFRLQWPKSKTNGDRVSVSIGLGARNVAAGVGVVQITEQPEQPGSNDIVIKGSQSSDVMAKGRDVWIIDAKMSGDVMNAGAVYVRRSTVTGDLQCQRVDVDQASNVSGDII